MIFTSDFKLGHYMKIPPRPMFWCQVRALRTGWSDGGFLDGWYV